MQPAPHTHTTEGSILIIKVFYEPLQITSETEQRPRYFFVNALM